MSQKQRILVAPLNWGLGHAARCIPIINALIENDFEPVLASDGQALELLKKEFPHLKTFELPSYNVTYSTKGKGFKAKIIRNSPQILKAISEENDRTGELVSELGISGIISDNRLGVRHSTVPSIIITHQLKVFSGKTTWISSRLHQLYIRKFDRCWVPDLAGDHNLSGELGHLDRYPIPTEHIGVLSRFEPKEMTKKYDLAAILSGPEPQRSMLEENLRESLKGYRGKAVMVQGRITHKQEQFVEGNLTIYNYMTSEGLDSLINESQVILSRSGYTTIMDLSKLQKKAFFIPTPGQYEQEYLATRLDNQGIIPSCSQSEFTLDQLKRLDDYSGFRSLKNGNCFEELFRPFKSE